MLPVLLMFRRLAKAVRYATADGGFLPVFFASILLIVIGTFTYSVTQDWRVVDGFYFAICTLTTSSIMNPDLTINGWAIELFTTFYVLLGIGILVEMIRQIGVGFVKSQDESTTKRKQKRQARRNAR